MWESFLQNDLLMIALGLLPAACVVIPCLFIRKMYSKTAYMVLTLTLAASIALTTTVGALNLNSISSASEDGKSREAYVPTNAEYLSAFSGFMLAKAYDEAELILNDYMRTYGYDDGSNGEYDYAARMKAELAYTRAVHAATDAEKLAYYESALAIWKEIDKDNLPEEALAAEKMIRYLNKTSTDDSEIELAKGYLANNGAGAEELINKKFRSRDNAESYQSAAELVLKTNQLFESGLTAELNELLEQYDDADNQKVLNAMSPWRVGELKVNLMNGDYDAIVNGIDSHATPEEYSAMIDLYIDGKISESTLVKKFDLKAPEGSDRVKKQLKELKSDMGKDLTDEQAALLNAKLTEIDRSQSNRVYYFFEEAVEDFISDPYCTADTSKLYFQLATLSAAIKDGETKKAEADAEEGGSASQSALYKLMNTRQNDYMAKSLDSSAYSDDALYRNAMNGLANVIAGSQSYTSTKDYASEAVENRYLIDGSEDYLYTGEYNVNEVVVNDLQAYTVKASIAISIETIDASGFPTVSATVQVSDEFFEQADVSDELVLRDCNRVITDYTLEKVEYSKSNYILISDNSGSMSDEIYDLKNSLETFINSASEGESYGFYTFSYSVNDEYVLGSLDKDGVLSAIDDMYASGNTAIYDTLHYALTDTKSKVPSDTLKNANNIIILFTDGADNESYNISQKTDEIIAMADELDFIIYTVTLDVYGSGNSDIDNFKYITETTGGSTMVFTDAEMINDFYTFIRSKAENKYIITYNAENTASEYRPFEVIFDEKNVSDIGYYSKFGTAVDNSTEIGTEYEAGKDVTGLDTNLMYISGNDTEVNVKGSGFTDSDILYVNLIGDRTYNLRGEYADAETFRIVIPDNIALGVYDAEISLNSGSKHFDSLFCVTDGSTASLKYGDYSFTASMQYPSGNGTVLSGNVVMNGWLHFNGDITINGDLENNSITVIDNYGSTIYYTDTSAGGYTAYLAENSIGQSIPALGSFSISKLPMKDINDIRYIYLDTDLELYNFFTLVKPKIALLYDELAVSFSSVRSELKFSEQLVTSRVSPDSYSYSNLYTCSVNGSGTIGKNGVYVSGDYTSSPYYVSNDVTLFGTDAYLSTPTVMSFSTETADATVSYLARIPSFITGDSNLTFTASWKNMCLDSASLELTGEVTKRFGYKNFVIAPFSIGFSDSAAFTKTASASDILAMELSGTVSVTSPAVNSYNSYLYYFMGEAPVFDITSAEISFPISKFSPTGTAEISFLGCDGITDAKVDLTNSAIRAVLPNGLDYSVNGLDMKLDGSVEIVSDGTRLGIVDYSGNIELTAGWWGETAVINGEASQMFFGISNVSNGSLLLQCGQLVGGNAASFSFSLGSNGSIGKNIGK